MFYLLLPHTHKQINAFIHAGRTFIENKLNGETLRIEIGCWNPKSTIQKIYSHKKSFTFLNQLL